MFIFLSYNINKLKIDSTSRGKYITYYTKNIKSFEIKFIFTYYCSVRTYFLIDYLNRNINDFISYKGNGVFNLHFEISPDILYVIPTSYSYCCTVKHNLIIIPTLRFNNQRCEIKQYTKQCHQD